MSKKNPNSWYYRQTRTARQRVMADMISFTHDFTKSLLRKEFHLSQRFQFDEIYTTVLERVYIALTRRYSPSKGKLKTFIGNQIRGEIKDIIIRDNKMKSFQKRVLDQAEELEVRLREGRLPTKKEQELLVLAKKIRKPKMLSLNQLMDSPIEDNLHQYEPLDPKTVRREPHELNAAVEEAVGKLPEYQQRAVKEFLMSLEGRTTSQIARGLKVTPGTIWSSTYDAKNKLRKEPVLQAFRQRSLSKPAKKLKPTTRRRISR